MYRVVVVLRTPFRSWMISQRWPFLLVLMLSFFSLAFYSPSKTYKFIAFRDTIRNRKNTKITGKRRVIPGDFQQ